MFGWSVTGGGTGISSMRRCATVASACCLALALITGAASAASPGKHHARHAQRALPPAAATGAFGLDLMRASAPGNLVLSPDSVAAALAMTGTGGVGSTAKEIARTLHLRGPVAFPAVGDLQRAIVNGQAAAARGSPDPPTLEIANGAFIQQELPLAPAFVSGLNQNFGVAPETVDFAGDPTEALNALNGWVSDRTQGLIPQILDSIPPNLALALANAAYLKASWRHPFEQRDTSPGPFFSGKARTPVQFMHQTERLPYASGRGYRAVSLPYRSSTLSLLVVLPVRQRLGSLLHRFSATALTRIARSLSPKSVILSLPRFHLNTQTDLTGTLGSLGMPTAFSDSADFSRITTATSLKIDFVKHVVDFMIDEEGTLAAAATVVGMVATSGPGVPIRAVRFNANRPFLFFLRDDRTGAVLFSGRLVNAASASP